ncbi:MAG: UDP-N-acetylglucosamine 2-epimerase [Minisyncoccia bacterium]
MKKKTVVVITGTRADYGLLRPVMQQIRKSAKLKLEVVVTGMHTLAAHGSTLKEVRADGMPIVAVVPLTTRDTMLTALSKEIQGIAAYCARKRPDLMVVLGDRDECFAGAIVGGHLGIPVAHIHGGDKTGSVVDEYIRHATTKFSHLHFAASAKSARRIKLLGEESWRVHMTGGPGLDELRTLKTPSVQTLAKRYGLSSSEPWHVILHHPASLDPVSYKNQAAGVFSASAKLSGEKIVLIPNSDTGSKEFLAEITRYKKTPGFHIFRHIPRADLIGILKHARLLIGNSSMGIIDASYLHVPTVNVGSRQEGRERGSNVLDCGYGEKEIIAALRKAQSSMFRTKVARGTSPYGDGRAAERIVRAIEKHIGRADLFRKKLTYV